MGDWKLVSEDLFYEVYVAKMGPVECQIVERPKLLVSSEETGYELLIFKKRSILRGRIICDTLDEGKKLAEAFMEVYNVKHN